MHLSFINYPMIKFSIRFMFCDFLLASVRSVFLMWCGVVCVYMDYIPAVQVILVVVTAVVTFSLCYVS